MMYQKSDYVRPRFVKNEISAPPSSPKIEISAPGEDKVSEFRRLPQTFFLYFRAHFPLSGAQFKVDQNGLDVDEWLSPLFIT